MECIPPISPWLQVQVLIFKCAPAQEEDTIPVQEEDISCTRQISVFVLYTKTSCSCIKRTKILSHKGKILFLRKRRVLCLRKIFLLAPEEGNLPAAQEEALLPAQEEVVLLAEEEGRLLRQEEDLLAQEEDIRRPPGASSVLDYEPSSISSINILSSKLSQAR